MHRASPSDRTAEAVWQWFLLGPPAISCRPTAAHMGLQRMINNSLPSPASRMDRKRPHRQETTWSHSTPAGVVTHRASAMHWGSAGSTLLTSRPPLTHTFWLCPPTRDSSPAGFRPCRFSRLRRLTPQPAFQHFSVGNASGVTTLQSFLSLPKVRRPQQPQQSPRCGSRRHHRCPDFALPWLWCTGSRPVASRGLQNHPPPRVVFASHRVSRNWDAQLSWAS